MFQMERTWFRLELSHISLLVPFYLVPWPGLTISLSRLIIIELWNDDSYMFNNWAYGYAVFRQLLWVLNGLVTSIVTYILQIL